MANIGDKYIIEIQDLGVGNDTYYLKNSVLNHAVVSGRALQGFEKYDPESEYQRGLNDAWEAAKKIINLPRDGGLTVYDLKNIFGIDYDDPEKVLKDFKGESAVKRIATYEAKKKAKEEIKVGDEITVRVHSPERTINVIVYDVLKVGSIIVYNTLSFEEGKCFNISWSLGIKKTGRHFPQVAELLDAMEEDGETNGSNNFNNNNRNNFDDPWIYGEKKSFNNGYCKVCNCKLQHFDTDSQGGRGYTCPNTHYSVWVSYHCVDKSRE